MSRVGLGDFVVDIVSGELWPAGAEGGRERIVLREQPLRVLRLLIEYDGRVAKPDRALAQIREAVRLLPSAQGYQWEAELSIAAGRVQEAKAAFDNASARGPDSTDVARSVPREAEVGNADGPAMPRTP